MECRDETETGKGGSREGKNPCSWYGKESTLKWERADTPQLRLRMLSADQREEHPERAGNAGHCPLSSGGPEQGGSAGTVVSHSTAF